MQLELRYAIRFKIVVLASTEFVRFLVVDGMRKLVDEIFQRPKKFKSRNL